MKILVGTLALAALLSGCATTPTEPPTAAQIEYCEKMLAMGEGVTHSHSAEKTGGQSPMALTHSQCRRTLARNSAK